MGSVLENGLYLPDEGERNAYDGLKGNWNTLDNLVETVTALSSTGLIRKPVDALPITDIQTNVIYLLKATKPNGDVYRIEYMYIDDHWDAVGTSETTLDDYYTKTETDNLPAVKSGINATKVGNYDTHLADTDIHVTLANKQTWDGKQNALDTAQTAAVNSGITGTKVTGYDNHVSDTGIHVTAADKTAWNGKQDGLSQTQIAAVNSGITDTKVTGYDSHVADTNVHVTTTDKATWSGKQDALTQTQLDNIATIPDKANSADLATVATSGSYTDLINAPTIPTVNNATLTIQKNGTDVATFTANASSNVTANLSIPVNTSDLNNDAGFLTQHNPIDNELSATSENALQNKVVKSELDGKAPLVHTHSASDVTSGTFNIARIPNLDASKITSGTIDIARLPKGSLERLIKVANQAARYALTTDDVQLGDTVQQLDTGVMYVVTDETKLDSADGYTEFTAGSASSVPWTGVTGKPSDYPPSSHTHTKSQITDFPAYGTTAGTICEGNDSRLSDARTPVAHTHLTADVTDLLNTSHEWTKEQVCDEGFTSKSTTMERCVTPATIQHINFTFKDKNGKGIGAVRRYFRNSGEQQIQIFGNTRIKDGQYDETGSDEFFGFSEVIHPDGTKYFSFDGYLNNSIRPRLTNTYQLGDSSYQWNNIYAKNYFCNGVAWGLDQANIWTGSNTYTTAGITLKNDYVARGTIPSVNRNYVLNFTDSNNDTVGMIFQQIRSGSGSYKMTFSLNNGTTDHRINFFGFTDGSSSFIPEVTNTTDLGSSTAKWKTLNGINPGALSIPDGADSGANSSFTPDTTNWPKDGTAFQAIMPIVGWLRITIKNVAGNYAFVRRGTAGANQPWQILADTSFATDWAELTLNVPVTNGTYTLKINSPGGFTAKVYPCLGNV